MAWWQSETIWTVGGGAFASFLSLLGLHRQLLAAERRGAAKALAEERAAVALHRSVAFEELRGVVATVRGELEDLRKALDAERCSRQAMRKELDEERSLRREAEREVQKLRNELHSLRNQLQRRGMQLPPPESATA